MGTYSKMENSVFDTNFPAKLPLGQSGLYFLLPSVFFGCPKNRRLASLAVYPGKIQSVNWAAWSLGTVNLPTFFVG